MSNSGSDPLVVREGAAAPSPRVKLPPQANVVNVPFDYTPSDDGTDENLLILLHGLGDTHVPFARLGKQLKLPQTATLALRAPEQIPYLYEPAFQWYESFDLLGEMLERPNPTSALELFSKVLNHLFDDCKWPCDRIHLFGFAQGGSVAAEFALKWWRTQLEKQRSNRIKPSEDAEEQQDGSELVPKALASIVTIAGPLLSYPTIKTPCPTPLLAIHRPAPSQTSHRPDEFTALRKAFKNVSEVALPKGEGMPRSRDEWEPIMRFWSERLDRRHVEGLYEVTTGGPPR
ncbi:hypothetical protein EUX98_g5673 [Antrodiella citrinella]|uniref:Phospholipase/carboxylesterase/thioesterase domain-containing protein n=1 Tax=Antrodiella citrinella TaxID=2447956 RepID=A0A4S4MT21_9APHY|nr:hypothetical protein EUX98_g5673 [Antrodiella citrinella]